MKKFLSTLALFGMGMTVMSQTTINQARTIQGNLNKKIKSEHSSSVSAIKGTSTCTDTVDYALYRSLDQGSPALITVTLENNPGPIIGGTGLYFPAPAGQQVNISGMELYAAGADAAGANTTVTINVYAAGADSLPSGTALATETLNMDTARSTFGDLYNALSFASPVSTTGGFVITVEAAVADSFSMGFGGVLTGAFDGYPTSFLVDGTWTKLYSTVQIGGVIPWIFPIVSYEATNSLSSSVTVLSMDNETVDFTVVSSGMGTSYLTFSGISGDQNTAALDFGDGNAEYNVAASVSHTYASKDQTYNVVLTDSIYLYNSAPEYCVQTETVVIDKATSVKTVNDDNFKAYGFANKIFFNESLTQITVYDISGKVVEQVPMGTAATKELPKGIYIVQHNQNTYKVAIN